MIECTNDDFGKLLCDECILWGSEHQERLDQSPDISIENLIDISDVAIGKMEPVKIFAFRITKAFLDVDTFLISVLEGLDENNMFEDDYALPTETMRSAASKFVDTILAEYEPSLYENTGSYIMIDPVKWCEEHNPDWLTI